jgi:hypothetical protein
MTVTTASGYHGLRSTMDEYESESRAASSSAAHGRSAIAMPATFSAGRRSWAIRPTTPTVKMKP